MKISSVKLRAVPKRVFEKVQLKTAQYQELSIINIRGWGDHRTIRIGHSGCSFASIENSVITHGVVPTASGIPSAMPRGGVRGCHVAGDTRCGGQAAKHARASLNESSHTSSVFKPTFMHYASGAGPTRE